MLDNFKRKAKIFFSLDWLRLIKLLMKVNQFKYVNKDSLDDEFIKKIDESISHRYIYILISDTGSDCSEMVRMVCETNMNHASISFTKDLDTIVSYCDGKPGTSPGLHPETMDDLGKKDDAMFELYKIKVTKKQKQAMIDRIKRINEEGSSYNLIGMFFKIEKKPNIMYCSEFVYELLHDVGIELFQRPERNIKPADFIRRNMGEQMEYVGTYDVCDV